MLYPLTFHPIFKERVWGGRNLARLYDKPLPGGKPIGESWEISDRPGDASVIANGPCAGRDLRWLMQHHARELLGEARPLNGRFPLLLKLLDAQEKLSLQVHPPAHLAAKLGGEPKTELWYIADAAPGAELFVGLKDGVTRAEFERKLHDGTVADCLQRVAVRSGDAMFLPSGRVHAIGAGLAIFEIQQNSDTTYRVFDWNRVGLDGKPRELHVPESLASIDFNDYKPGLVRSEFSGDADLQRRELARDTLFSVESWHFASGAKTALQPHIMQILACLNGDARIEAPNGAVELFPGGFCLVPACLETATVQAASASGLLCVRAG